MADSTPPNRPTVRKVLRALPATFFFVLVCTILLLAVDVYRLAYPENDNDALWRLGAVETWVQGNPPDPESEESILGPFDLWKGELWRIGVSPFHHVHVLHLLLNCLWLVMLGILLEPRLGHWRFALFFVVSAIVSLIPEFLIGNLAIGISGGTCALFGLAIVWRRTDPVLARALPDWLVIVLLASLLLGVVATQLNLLLIANLGHFTGLFYGWLAGEAYVGSWRHNLWARRAFLTAHLFLIPAGWFLMHPIWNANYYAYQAVIHHDPKSALQYYQQASRLDPTIPAIWIRLAKHQALNGDLQAAWKSILEGLSHNRSSKVTAATARTIWNEFDSASERREAIRSLQTTFGEEARAWRERLGITDGEYEQSLQIGELPNEVEDPPRSLRIDQRIRLPAQIDGGEPLPKFELIAPPFDPDSPDSAVEGVAT